MAKTSAHERFYGWPIPALARRLCREKLTYASTKDAPSDLVAAHLKSNFAYFGSLDKTLAGFFILDDQGDDYTLLDLREKNGMVWFLDHEELSLEPRFATLADYARARATKRRPPAPKPRHARKPETPRLWRRYRWLVWLLAQPKQIDDDEAIATAKERLTNACGGDFTKYTKAFEADLPLLAKDPSVLVYWLLHFTCLGQDAERDRVVHAARGTKNELARAFLATFGAMGADGALAVLPAFRLRRSRLIFALARELAKDPFGLLLKAFEIDPADRGIEKAVAVWAHAKTDALRARVREVAARTKGRGADYLRLELAAAAGAPKPAEWLLEHEPYRLRFLELAQLGGGGRAIAARLDAVRKVEGVLAAIREATAKARKKATATIADVNRAVKPALKGLASEVAARQIIARPDEYADVARFRAFEIIRTTKPRPADRIALLATAAMGMHGYEPMKAAARRAKKGDAEAIAFLAAVLAYDERACNEYHALYAKECALEGLGVRLAAPALLESCVERLGQPGYGRLTSALFSAPFSRWDKASILKRLPAAQARTLAIALIGQPPPKHSSNDKPKAALEVLLTPALHADLVKAIQKTRDRKRAARYAGMLEDFDGASFDAETAAKAATKVRALLK